MISSSKEQSNSIEIGKYIPYFLYTNKILEKYREKWMLQDRIFKNKILKILYISFCKNRET